MREGCRAPGGCPVAPGLVCLGEHARRCCDYPAMGGKHLEYLLKASTTPREEVEPTPAMSAPAPDMDVGRLMRIATCDFRYSACNCLSKPARCSLAGFPAVVTRKWCESCPIVLD